jgi:NAD(P)-dependent dehydrogenase (short-subunit alcohol dehydrogenase family)
MSEATGMLSGLAALVLGSDDIGAGIARRFHREGARVSLLDPLEPRRAARLAAALPGAVGPPDEDIGCADPVTLAAAVTESLESLGRLDVLICNLLPPPRPKGLEFADDATLEPALMAIRCTVAAMRAALPALRRSGRGRIVLVGHRYGECVGEAIGPYNAAAWSLVGLARSAAIEWGPHQIATNVLLPLARTSEFEAARERRPAIIERLIGQLPLRRVGDPEEDIGGAAAFLASDAAGFVNGEVLCADGGQQVAGPVLNPARFRAACRD